VFEAAVTALGMLGDRRAVKYLIPFLHDGGSNDFVADALCSIGGAAARRALDKLEGDESEDEFEDEDWYPDELEPERPYEEAIDDEVEREKGSWY